MKMTIEVESLDDLISLIGLVRVMQEKKVEEKEVTKPETTEDLTKKAKRLIQTIRVKNETNRREEFLDCPIAVLNLWPPAEQSLNNNGIRTVRDLSVTRVSSLRKMKHVGVFTLRQIKHEFATHGIQWGGVI